MMILVTHHDALSRRLPRLRHWHVHSRQFRVRVTPAELQFRFTHWHVKPDSENLDLPGSLLVDVTVVQVTVFGGPAAYILTVCIPSPTRSHRDWQI